MTCPLRLFELRQPGMPDKTCLVYKMSAPSESLLSEYLRVGMEILNPEFAQFHIDNCCTWPDNICLTFIRLQQGGGFLWTSSKTDGHLLYSEIVEVIFLLPKTFGKVTSTAF